MLKRISLFTIIALIFASCSGEEEKKPRELHEYVSASMKDNKEVIAFGSVEVKGIIDKTDYENEDMLKGLIGEELKKLDNVLDMSAPVYFYVEGPISEKGSMKRTVMFMKVKDAEKLAIDLEKERSFLVEKTGDIRYAEDNEFVIGFKDDLAIAVVQPEEYDAAKMLKKLFKKADGDLSGGKTDEMLEAKGDVVVNVNMESLYGTSNTSLNSLSADKLKKIQKMAEGSYIQTMLSFNDGAMVLESKNYFSKEMQEIMFFESKSTMNMKSKLAKGKTGSSVVGGLTVNLDVKKMEKFYQTYAPEVMEEMKENMKELGPLMQFVGGGDVISSLITGELGMLFIAQDADADISIGTKAVLGTTDSGQKAFMMMRSEMDMPEEVEFEYMEDGIVFYNAYDGGSTDDLKGGSKLILPKEGQDLGKKGVYGFIDFDALAAASNSRQEAKMLEMLDYATLEGDNNSMKIVLQMKNTNDNVLKQFTQMAMNMMPMMMGGGMGF